MGRTPDAQERPAESEGYLGKNTRRARSRKRVDPMNPTQAAPDGDSSAKRQRECFT